MIIELNNTWCQILIKSPFKDKASVSLIYLIHVPNKVHLFQISIPSLETVQILITDLQHLTGIKSLGGIFSFYLKF